MSTHAQNRQPPGRPTGGEYAPTVHAEPAVSLAATARRPELDGWPESLPEPEVSFSLNDDGSLTTTVSIDGESAFEAWNPHDDAFSTESSGWDHAAVTDDSVREEAEAWARDKHDEMVAEMRRELRATFERSRARILADATGKPQQLDQEQMAALISANTDARAIIQRDTELASTALAAQKILSEHPTAEYAEILTDSWDNGEFVSGARILDADRNELHTYEDYNEEHDGDDPWTVMGLVRNLNANPADSHWAGAFSVGAYGEDLHMLDLRKAQAWTPGSTT